MQVFGKWELSAVLGGRGMVIEEDDSLCMCCVWDEILTMVIYYYYYSWSCLIPVRSWQFPLPLALPVTCLLYALEMRSVGSSVQLADVHEAYCRYSAAGCTEYRNSSQGVAASTQHTIGSRLVTQLSATTEHSTVPYSVDRSVVGAATVPCLNSTDPPARDLFERMWGMGVRNTT